MKLDYEPTEFDKWLFEEPWRLERYYDMVPGYTEEDKKNLRYLFTLKNSEIFIGC